MPKFLRAFAGLLFVAAALQAIPRNPPVPMCYDLPTCTFQGGHTWTQSHPCQQGSYTAYVYINEVGDWCLYGPVMP